jgi:hypothetical protein
MSRRLISNTEVLAEMLQDPQFKAEWERTALAWAVAEAVIHHHHGALRRRHRPHHGHHAGRHGHQPHKLHRDLAASARRTRMAVLDHQLPDRMAPAPGPDIASQLAN